MTRGFANEWQPGDPTDVDGKVQKMDSRPEFCVYCGAGIGKFRRDGEGTCPKCEDLK